MVGHNKSGRASGWLCPAGCTNEGIVPTATLLWVQLSEDLPGVSLALSLHAPNQELRQSIVPSARAYKLDKLMAAVDKYEQSSRQKVTFSASVVMNQCTVTDCSVPDA